MLDLKKTIKKSNQSSSPFFNSFRFIFKEYLITVPSLLFKTIGIADSMTFNENDFDEARQ